ncbi:MAG: PQQ-dependent sugar dehydrogenase [Phycisphaeraceae bacterium]|nr:PQQ-dependent sugar dehydrogenase [Phycisphaeraceae bacterium]
MRFKTSAIVASAVLAASAMMSAQAGSLATLSLQNFASGLSRPVSMYQHPTVDGAFLVVEQGGTIRVVQNGVVTGTFLTVAVGSSSGERGLFSLAFDPDFETTGRFWVNHTNASAATVIARYQVSANPLVADAASRTEILVIAQPFTNHNGGCITFGPDGYLHIGMGDGGSAGDPGNRSQTPGTLLGKMLRIDVRVPVGSTELYRIPADNPFLPGNNPPVAGALPEIWAFGVRNPWKFTFDDFGVNATNGMLMGDVGQNAWEEYNFQPANQGGINWGWRLKEGLANFNTSLPAAYLPLTDPILVYGRGLGGSTTGGYVYRGTKMCSYAGRYFYADYISGRVWSFKLENGTAVNNIEHSSSLFPGTRPNVSSFARDFDGELYILEYNTGMIKKIVSNDAPFSGDFNADGAVDFADLNLVLTGFGTTYTFSDLNAVLSSFGRSCAG